MPKICFNYCYDVWGNTSADKIPPLCVLHKKITIYKYERYLSQARPIISY